MRNRSCPETMICIQWLSNLWRKDEVKTGSDSGANQKQ